MAGWITRGKQIGQAVKNVQRLRQIVTVFSKHGYEDLINRIGLGSFLTGLRGKAKNQKAAPERLREAFEELGPTFIKLGQLLSTRPDLIPESYIEAFTKLQDNVNPLEYSTIQKVIESELQRPIEACYRSVETKPLASASIAQVHQAKLRSGESVVIKVQRPGIQTQIRNDVSLLNFIAKLLEKYVPETRIINPTVIIDEFFRTLSFELDFFVEANNMRRFRENMKEFPDVVIPRVYKEFSSSKIITLQELKGIRVNNLKALDEAGVDRSRVVEVGAKAFFKSIMIDGLFHGDLHGGNVFVLPENKIGLIDFGIVGRLPQKSRDQLAGMFLSLMTEDYERLCYQYADLGAAGPSIDFDNFQREVKNSVSPYMGLNISEVNSGKILVESTKIATKYEIRVPGDWMLVFKAILTMEGMGRTLDPNFDLLKHGQGMLRQLIKNQYSLSRISREGMNIAKDLLSLLESYPRQLKWLLARLNKNDLSFEIRIKALEQLQEELKENSKKTSLSILGGAAFIACSIAIQFKEDSLIFGYPAVSFLFFSIGILILVRILISR